IVPLPTTIDESFHLPSREVISRYITGKTRAILYSSPGNPTGVIYSRQEMETLAEIALAKGIFLISDEVYREFIYDPSVSFSSVFDFPEIKHQAILTDSISKRFSSCGARVGFLATANEEVLSAVHKFAQARLSSPTVEQRAAEAAYRMDPSYFHPIRAEYRLRRDTLTAGLQAIDGVELHVPEGAFYLMVRLPVDDAERFAIFLLSEFAYQGKTVMVAPANGFYSTPGKGVDEVRIAYVLNQERLVESIRIIERALTVYREKTERKIGVCDLTDSDDFGKS
ncbi:MAG TPA: aminotransferase class I/II-fold pyridoxal phosphate-dependent enzyme, partial [Atribacteraceae bacterium]|nr:aminotransferase class I/II-fold pyridoxal phosphate-dependent enzyme [Atribacteraceae bacterium]